jgi:protein pelota
MSQKDFQEQQKKYYDEILGVIKDMVVDTVVIAGPGFTKDDLKAHGESSGFLKKLNKRLFFENVSNSERSGVYELIKSDKFSMILQKERIRAEFKLIEEFLTNLSTGKSKYGIANVRSALEGMEANIILVNDNVLGDPETQQILGKAEKDGIKIEVINSGDEVGEQLHAFKDMASIA